MSRFFAIVTRWFGSVSICIDGIVGCGLQYLFVARQGLPNHLVPIPFLGVSQSVHMCRFPDGPDSLIFSGAVAFWHI